MSPAKIRAASILHKTEQMVTMLGGIADLPLESLQALEADPRNAAAAESFLRRALEALLDLGRHVLAKGFGRGRPSTRRSRPNWSALR